MTAKSRLERGVAVLAAIDQRRHQTDDPSVGAAVERYIVDRELIDLVAEVMAEVPESTEIHIPKRRIALLATAGRWFRKRSH
jgi:hypothetical protein